MSLVENLTKKHLQFLFLIHPEEVMLQDMLFEFQKRNLGNKLEKILDLYKANITNI